MRTRRRRSEVAGDRVARAADARTRSPPSSAIPRAYGSYEALLADPDVDAVYIPLPNHLHARVDDRGGPGRQARPVREAARDDGRRGPGDGRRAAARPGVLLMEAFMYRLHPSWIAVRELVASGPDRPAAGGRQLVLVLQRRPGQHPEHPRGRRRRPVRHRLLLGQPVADAVRRRARPTSRRRSVRDPAIGRRRADQRRSSSSATGVATFTCSTRTETDQRVAHLRHRGPDLDRDPVQHPARPPDAGLRDRRRRSAGRARRPRR